VNGAAVLVLVCLAIYFGIHEWQMHVLNGQIAQAQQVIDHEKKPSDQAVALYKRFQAEETKVKEVDAFVKSRPLVSNILIRFAETLPENIAIDAFDLRTNGLTLRLTVRGTPEAAAGFATAYLEQLRADKELTAFDHAKFEFENQARNPSTGRLAVEFFLPYAPQYMEKRP
jgi:Tfp pilus assembly protein PilN